MYGSQVWGDQTYHDYPGSGTKDYTIEVGSVYTGARLYLVFANDADAPAVDTATSTWSNLRLVNAGAGTTPTFPTATVESEVNASPSLTALTVTSTFNPVTASGGVNATSTPTSLPATATFPPAGYTIDSQITLTALEIQATLPLVVISAGSTVALTTLQVVIGLPQVQAIAFFATTKGYVAVTAATVGGVAITDRPVGGDVVLSDALAGVLSTADV